MLAPSILFTYFCVLCCHHTASLIMSSLCDVKLCTSPQLWHSSICPLWCWINAGSAFTIRLLWERVLCLIPSERAVMSCQFNISTWMWFRLCGRICLQCGWRSSFVWALKVEAHKLGNGLLWHYFPPFPAPSGNTLITYSAVHAF